MKMTNSIFFALAKNQQPYTITFDSLSKPYSHVRYSIIIMKNVMQRTTSSWSCHSVLDSGTYRRC